MKKIFFLVAFITVLLCFDKLVYSATVNGEETIITERPLLSADSRQYIPGNKNNAAAVKELTLEKAIHKASLQYAPNEIIVKFKTEQAKSIEAKMSPKGEISGSVSLTSSLDKLNKKHKVKTQDIFCFVIK
ncbi:MAG: hypothetical protein KKD29_07670 [Candidatus Omnitrophica bacterium]|nr:hypothetical protein [Candidatus Omnitrophota bacterium]MCG2705886.1 hypothetical protein [Candidatus Omnitrophota bacterium]